MQEITYGIHRSPFGWCAIGITELGICHLSFLKSKSERGTIKNLKEQFPDAQLTRNDKKIKPYIQKIFTGKNSGQAFDLLIEGTDFQIKVWKALLAIPYGKTKSYGEIAKEIGSPKAVRAVGSACGKNSIAYLIPCHRVLTSSGGIGGYRWGTAIKKSILASER